MRKITIKRGEEKIKIPIKGIFVNGFIIMATMEKNDKNVVQCIINKNTPVYKEK